MNRYKTLKYKQEKERQEANLLGYAFGKDQFKELLEGWGLDINNEDDIKKVAHVYSGAYILVEDIPKYKELVERQRAEFDSAVAEDKTGDGFIYEMFRCELDDYEYSYTGDPEDALETLGYTYEDVYNNTRLSHGLKKAMDEIMKGEN